MSQTFILEIGCEEIPARFMTGLCENLTNLFEEELQQSRLKYEALQCMGTYRRLIVQISQLVNAQEDYFQLIKGPPKTIALDESGQLTKAGEGFCRKNKVRFNDCEVQKIDHIEYLVTNRFHKGKRTKECLAGIVSRCVARLPLPIAMKWGEGNGPFIRPIQWIYCVFGKDIISLNLFGQKASNKTFGHRTLTRGTTFNGGELTIKEADDFFNVSRTKGHVVIDASERKKMIQKQLKQSGKPDPQLLNEVVYLAEKPMVLTGVFDEKYLELPEFVLIECMKKHQKYFPIFNEDGQLQNQCLIVADNVTKKNQKQIIKGNETVLKARLNDALFFYEEDKKKSLDVFVEKLKGVVFQKNLGSLHDKCARLSSLCTLCCDKGIVSLDQKLYDRMVYLAKFDLVTQMVFEFPELQGKMGHVYAKHANEPLELASAIEEHYLPKTYGDSIPTSNYGILLSLVDRSDTLVASFFNGFNPTGSQDPQGLRRLVFTLFTLIDQAQLDIDLVDLFDDCYRLLGDQQKNKGSLIEFVNQRFKTFLIDQGVAYDVADMVLSNALKNIVKTVFIAKQIMGFRHDSKALFKLITETAVRTKRLAQKSEEVTVDTQLFQYQIEHDVNVLVNKMAPQTINNQSETNQMDTLQPLSEKMTIYFDEVLVMDKDEHVRLNRLALLKQVSAIYEMWGDFEKIVIS